ncbi:MAG: DUF2059 domain-containing protein [Rhodobacteraceae bacterium]|nr:DUF2059 domain-containing protein [Paracoccaceae bacterium]
MLQRVAVWLVGLTLLSLPAQASDDLELRQVMRLDDLAMLLHQEGVSQGQLLDADLLAGRGGVTWQNTVQHSYDPDRIASFVNQAIQEDLTHQQIVDVQAFYRSEFGRRVLGLELQARELMANPDIEAEALVNRSRAAEENSALYRSVRTFMQVNDLVELNVKGALNSNEQFLRAFVRQGSSHELDDLWEIWTDAQRIEANVIEWLEAYLLLAYGPLENEEMSVYIAFCKSSEGQAVNRSLFRGFDIAYREIYGELGAAAASVLVSEDL